MTAGPKILGIIVAVVTVMLAALAAVSDEWTNCHLHSWSKGYFGAPSFPPGIVVSGNAAVKTIDFRRVPGLVEVCAVRMQYYAEPSFSRSMLDRGFRSNRPTACWRDTPGQIIVVARSKDMPLAWEQINVGDPDSVIGDNDCAEIGNAVLTCRDKVCEFSQ